jgi:16S rRNA processing protein RimM
VQNNKALNVVDNEQIIVLGRFGSAHGIKGMVKVYSNTNPPEGILQYQPWLVKKGREWQTMTFKRAEKRAKFLVVSIDGYQDRTSCETLTNCEIGIVRQQLPELEQDEYYWSDLEGLTVSNTQGQTLGTVSHLMDTGSNDVLVIIGEKKRHLVPFLMGDVIIQVSLEDKHILVDWDAEF